MHPRRPPRGRTISQTEKPFFGDIDPMKSSLSYARVTRLNTSHLASTPIWGGCYWRASHRSTAQKASACKGACRGSWRRMVNASVIYYVNGLSERECQITQRVVNKLMIYTLVSPSTMLLDENIHQLNFGRHALCICWIFPTYPPPHFFYISHAKPMMMSELTIMLQPLQPSIAHLNAQC